MRLMRKRFLKAAAIILWLLVWQILSVIIGKDLLLPSPYITFATLIRLLSQSAFYNQVLYSLLRIVAGFLTAVVSAFLLGVIAGLNKNVEILLSPFITVIRSTPVMSFIILAIIWFSYNLAPLAVNIIMCFPPIYDNVVKGIRSTDNKLLDMAKVYQVRPVKVFTGVYLASVKPFLMAGMNTALGLAFRVAVAAGVLANPQYGIGTKLLQAKYNLDTAEVFAWTFVILLLSFLFEQLFKKITEGGRKNAPAEKSDKII